jgi:repressor LexA
MALTRRQRQILDFITRFIEEHRYSPTLQEIGQAFGLSSVATVHKHVSSLVEKGYVRRGWNQNRSIEPVVQSRLAEGSLDLPLLGQVAAGAPIEAVVDRETITVPESLVGRHPTFVLRVRGNSMIDEAIKDGDYIIVEERDHAENGETVVALLQGEEVTLKKYYRDNGEVRLQPANPEVAPLVLPETEVQVRGVVVGIIRRYPPR